MLREGVISDEPGTTLQDLLQLRHLTLSTRELSVRGLTHLPGKVQSRRRGNGLDFDDLRRYQPGDDVRHIDWNVTARTQQTHLRLYREDRERALTVAVDLRACMFTGSKCFLADRALRLAGLSLWQAARNGDRCAAVVLDDDGIHSSRPRIAERGALEALGLLARRYEQADKLTTHNASPPLTDLLLRLNQTSRLAGKHLLFSGLSQPGANLAEQLPVSAAKRCLSVVELIDPLEQSGLPPGIYPYQHSGQNALANLNKAEAKSLKKKLDAALIAKRAPWQKQHIPLHRPDELAAHFLQQLHVMGLL